jgi:hypothetical protein
MAEAVYVLGTLTSVACAVLLLRSHRRSRANLLLWSGLCFGGLAVNNVFLLVDLYVVPSISLALARSAITLASLLLLLFGLTWNTRS